MASSPWVLESLSQLSPQSKSCVAGAMSGTCSALLFQPFELAKTRSQQMNILTKQSTSLSTSASTLKLTSITSFVGEWWRGTSASVLRVLPGAAIYFGCLHGLQSSVMARDLPRHPGDAGSSMGALQALALGASARSLAAMAVIPMTVVKTRLESNLYVYNSIRHALTHIWRVEGPRGLTRGLTATLLRDAPYSGLVFMFYSRLKQRAFSEDQSKADGSNSKKTFRNFLCGLSAAILASLATHPLDVIKTHMQLRPQTFLTMKLTVNHIWLHRGLAGFGAGITARMTRRTLMSATSWTVYDEITTRLKLK